MTLFELIRWRLLLRAAIFLIPLRSLVPMVFLFGALGAAQGDSRSDTETATLYINKYFEVRDHDAPTKYVWNGATRVAKVTGSLSANSRVQRLRLFDGWNLVSVAVSAPDFLSEISNAAYKWNPAASNFVVVSTSETLSPGTVVWLNCRSNVNVAAAGSYSEPAISNAHPSSAFEGNAGLQTWDLGSFISNWPPSRASFYDASSSRWLSWLPGLLNVSSESALPKFLSPGSAIFVGTEESVARAFPVSTARVVYYHQDHLGSSSQLTDVEGNCNQSQNYYAFGSARIQQSSEGSDSRYAYLQKERDLETSLSYFEARYLWSSAAHFISVDSLALTLNNETRSEPQYLNPYTYALNGPLRLADPSGKQAAEAIVLAAAVTAAETHVFDLGLAFILGSLGQRQTLHKQQSQPLEEPGLQASRQRVSIQTQSPPQAQPAPQATGKKAPQPCNPKTNNRRFRELKAAKKEMCEKFAAKDFGGNPPICVPGMTTKEITDIIARYDRCLEARWNETRECYGGTPDDSHLAREGMWETYRYRCEEMLKMGEPPPAAPSSSAPHAQ